MTRFRRPAQVVAERAVFARSKPSLQQQTADRVRVVIGDAVVSTAYQKTTGDEPDPLCDLGHTDALTRYRLASP